MVNPIPKSVKRVWDTWNLRGVILFSLSLQTSLILCSPLRKRTANKLVIMFIWSSYLLADWAANFAVGLISNSNNNDTPGAPDNPNLLAFWAPFLLLHLGGPDTITAFALEDNELWLRHLLGLVFQFVAAAYIFLPTNPGNNLWIPTVLLFVAGTIKYAERTRALYLASMDRFRESMLKEPDPGPNYAKLMEEYSSKKDAKLPTEIIMIAEPDKETKEDINEVEEILDERKVVKHAYDYFNIFKGLIVDLIFSFKERNESRDFFHKRSPEDAFRIIEVELNFIYEVLYTKVVVVHDIFGIVFQFISFSSVVAALAFLHYGTGKNNFHKFDVRVTYILLWGAICLEMIAFLMLISSDWTFAALQEWEKNSCFAAACLNILLKFRSSRQSRYEGKPHTRRSVWLRRWSESVSRYNLITYCLGECPKRIYRVNDSSGVFAQVIYYLRVIRDRFVHIWSLGIDKVIDYFGARDFLDSWKYVSDEPFTEELWKFIFTELKRKSKLAENPATAKKISSARGEWVLEDSDGNSKYSKLMHYVEDVEYDQSLLLWHIATELCYNANKGNAVNDDKGNAKKSKFSQVLSVLCCNNDKGSAGNHEGNVDRGNANNCKFSKLLSVFCYNSDKRKVDDSIRRSADKGKPYDREFGKLLSDYMLYLLVMQPTMMSSVAGIGQIRFRDTCAEAKRFFGRRGIGPKQEQMACENILSVNTDVEPVAVKGDRSKSVMFDASMLAKELNKLGEKEKWKIISKVWVELLSYAASHCRANTLAQQVSKGGELITFIWLLMAHFGLGEQFQINEGHARAKLIVGK